MILDPYRFSFVPRIEAGYETFLGEFDALDQSCLQEWPDREAYRGTWLTVPLFMSSHHEAVGDWFAANQQACPETTSFLREIPGVISAGFSLLRPGGHILPHVDTKPDDVLRTHLGLRIPEGSAIRVVDERLTWQERRCLIFDGNLDHETANLSESDRLVLLVDARLNAEEYEYLVSCSAVVR